MMKAIFIYVLACPSVCVDTDDRLAVDLCHVDAEVPVDGSFCYNNM